MQHSLIEKIDAILPQTQCGKCGFPGCRPYAVAIAEGRADINQCPPGDVEGIHKLAELLGVEPKPLNTAHGFPKPRMAAQIDEHLCIGCTFCIRSCPVDAIVGAAKQMHTVIATECTGCELCVDPCPMDCIHMIPINDKLSNEANKKAANVARSRYQFRLQRLARDKQTHRQSIKHKNNVQSESTVVTAELRKQTIVQTAIKRALAARKSHQQALSNEPHELN
jgi:electron transport complex protein RnfB